ncbi:Asp23/Gls24 family envelope stress response protein [Micromonospora eburnea]|uniref:Asp23 family, cell envelope-related function n=1 Tax=Micromonospora eburnea TaxID=227316 RepID=A0A1C6UE47_9ACTN|nr:Asp23/Gls24 family envelope stress response protein [Micromonospora eburnea]SCL52375.1 Asp23 family, cell envelope-related function [Micromonospora eburnea]
MTGILPRRGPAAPESVPAATRRSAGTPEAPATPQPKATATPEAASATPPATAREAVAPVRPWTEDRIARLVEDAARRTPAARDAAATVRVHGGVARVDLDLVVDHGTHLPTVAEAVRRRIGVRVGAETGLTVEGTTVTVADLCLPDPADPAYHAPSADADAWKAT